MTTISDWCYCYPHFTDEETETQGDKVIHQCLCTLRLDLNAFSSCSKLPAFPGVLSASHLPCSMELMLLLDCGPADMVTIRKAGLSVSIFSSSSWVRQAAIQLCVHA